MENGQYLTRDEILNADDIKYKDVDVPEWGKDKKVRIKALSGSERDAFEVSMVRGEGPNRKMDLTDIRSKLAALSIVDGAGNPLFTMADVKILGKKSAAALGRVFDAAQELSAVSDADVEELAKNSGSVPSEDS